MDINKGQTQNNYGHNVEWKMRVGHNNEVQNKHADGP